MQVVDNTIYRLSLIAMRTFTELPSELVVLILTNLPAVDLVRCQQLSKYWYTLINNHAGLQYSIALALTSMEDACATSFSSREKLDILNSFQRMWTSGSPFESETIWPVVPYNDHMNLAQDTMVQGIGMRSLKFTRMSCDITSASTISWDVELDFDIVEFTFDPDEGLLIAIEARDNRCYVRLLDTNTGRGHKNATQDSLYIGEFGTPGQNDLMPLDGENLILDTRSAEDMLVILANWEAEERTMYRLTAWNWHEGTKFLELSPSMDFLKDQYISSASPLNGRQIILGVTGGGQSDNQRGFAKVLDLTLGRSAYMEAVTLEFPPLTASLEDLSIWRNVPATPSRRSLHHNYLPFQCTQDDAIISFGLLLDPPNGHDLPGEYHFVIPTSKFIRCVERAAKCSGCCLPWAEWLPDNCRLFSVDGAWDVAGSRGIRQSGGHIEIMNFAEAAVRRHETSPNNDYLTLVNTPVEVNAPVFWKCPITTSLPYLMHSVPLPDETQFEAVYCGSDTIFLCNVRK
ncbi:unnamed protein product [Somion occarium]|uniref:F-box domain-containing protein n=2 Tax=Somion occarium TaxID=3059160 RepID=A0ABP1DXS7_9APHY